MKTGSEIVAEFERAVIEAQHKLATPANRNFVARLREQLAAMVDAGQDAKP